MSQTTALPSERPTRAAIPTGFRLDSLTGLRFVAAGVVFLAHIGTTSYFANQGINAGLFRAFSHAGPAAVTFFFVLSGFVMTVSIRSDDTPWRFIRRRMVKIFPNHLVTFVVAAFLFGAAFTVGRAIPNLFLLQAWFPQVESFFSVNPVAWTLSCELLFYLLFPFIYPALSRIRPDRLWRWMVGVVVGIVGMWVIATTLIPATPALSFPPFPIGLYQYWFVYILPPVRLLEFVLGIIMARIVISGRWINVGMGPCVLLALGGLALTDQAPPLLALSAIMAAPMALLVAATGWTDLTGQPSSMRKPAWVFLGELSFAFYIVHGLVLFGTRPFLGVTNFFSVPAGIGLIVLAFFVSLFLAFLLYRFVEAPMVRRFSSPRRRTPAPVGRSEPGGFLPRPVPHPGATPDRVSVTR